MFSHENIQILKAVKHNKIQYSTKELNIPFIKIANLIRKDGSVVTTEINAKFFYNNQISKFQIIATARDIYEKRKIELALKNNEKQLRSIIETSPEGIGITNLSGEISYASKKLLEIFGYESIDEIIGKKLIDFIQIDYQEKALYFLNEMLNGNHTGTAEYLAIKKDGTEIFIESNANILFEEDRPTGILLISRDVTDRKLSENLLIESENRLKLIVETSPDAIISTSLDGKIMTASNQAAKIFGYSNSSELLGKYTLDFIHPDYLETAKIRMTERILQGNTNPFEYLMIRKDSSHIFIEASASLLKNKYQKPMGLIYIARDITERKIVEKNLAESKERYKTLVESANEGISVILNFEIVFINKKICEIIDTNSEKLLNKSILEYVVDEDIDLVSNYFNSFDHTLYSNDNFEFRIITRNNNVKWLEIKTVLIEWNGSKASLNFINDITYKKNAEIELFRIYEDLRISNEEIEVNLFQKNTLIEELENIKSTLEKVNSTKDKFFSIIAHDLRNPLGNFRTTTKLLFDSYDDFQEEERLEFLEVIKNSADNIYSLLENLLEWSRAQRGSIEFRPDNFDLYYLIENNISLLRLSASNKRVTLKNNVKFSTYLFADINLITTIIRNLISNAIKFTPTDGEIAIGITSNENENIISIKDSGVGMNQDTLNKLFRIDTNFSTLGTSSERGTGLGLILCKEFVDLHNGKIWAESEFGKGSTFFFSIPKN